MSDTPAPVATPTSAEFPAAEGREIRHLLHEVNNHLGVVVAHLDLMTGREDLPADVQASVQESIDACVAVIEDLRTVQAIARRLVR